MKRRLIAAGVCFGLLVLGPSSLSLCAMLANLPADCMEPATAPDKCQQMTAPQSEAALSGSQNCCQLASPASDAVATAKKTVTPQVEQTATASSATTGQVLPAVRASATTSLLLAFPSERQSRLCVFLI